jgi:uncharacterized membrane protein (DUF2068 family)
MPLDAGVRLITLYKLLKGGVALAGALALAVLLLAHATGPIEALGHEIRHHFAGAWSVELAKLLLSAAQPHHLWLVALALTLDGGLTLVEAWALRRGHWWGAWLVVIATSSLVPFEIVALVHAVHFTRVVVLLVNVAIVVYLVRRAPRRRPTSGTTV